MDAATFDRLTRFLTISRSRRHALFAITAGTILGKSQRYAAAGPGCRNVGKKCKKANACCSSICRGKKGKKRCKAHDTGGCPPGRHSEFCVGTPTACITGTGFVGTCETTTGNAGYCAAVSAGLCMPCSRDKECRPIFGQQAACVVCAGCPEGVGCAGPSEPA